MSAFMAACKFPIAFTLLIYVSIFVEQQMCSRFDEECITSRADEVRELFSMPNLYLCDSPDNPKCTVSGSAETSWHAFFNISGFLLSPYSFEQHLYECTVKQPHNDMCYFL